MLGMIPAPTFALPDGVTITNSGSDPTTALPTSLQNGELWTDKSVSYAGDGIFNITLSAIGQDFKVTNPPKKLDVILALDFSYSMNSNSKLTNEKNAAKAIAGNLIDAGHRVAIVKYNDSASLQYNFSTNKTNVQNKIDEGFGGTYTDIQNAFLVSEQTFNNRPSKTNQPVLIIISDGEPTIYHENLADHSINSQRHQSASSGSDYVWWTIQQGMKLKLGQDGIESDDDVKIYTIGFDLLGNSLAASTLQPTESNTSSVRPSAYNFDERNRQESGLYRVKSNGSLYTPIESTGTITTVLGNWTANTASSSPSNYLDDPVLSGSTQIINGTRYKQGVRSGKDYQNIIFNQEAFNQKYWEDGFIIGSDYTSLYNALNAITQSFSVSKPLQYISNTGYSNLVIEDVLGSGFELLGLLPSGMSQSGNTLTWTVNGDDFVTMPVDSVAVDPLKVSKVTFQVKVKDNAAVNTQLFTNASAKATFTVTDENPFYPSAPLNREQNLPNKGWLTLSAPPVHASITVTKQVIGPVTNVARVFSFTLYDAASNGNVVSGPINITVTGASSNTGTFTFDIPYNGFSNNQVTYYIQENESAPNSFWSYDNTARKAITLSRAVPTGSKTFTNSYAPTGTLTVDKTWTGDGPDTAASFKLYKKVGNDWVAASQGSYSIDTSSPATSQVTISNLSLDTEYKVIEDPMLDYEVSYSPQTIMFNSADLIAGNGVLTKNITITNEYHKPIGKITINKVWSDAEDVAQDRPSELTFNIVGPEAYDGPSTITLKASEGWTKDFETEVFGTYQFTEVLPLDYVITENTLNPQSQSVSILPVDAREASLTFSNTYVEPKGSLTIKKIWENEDDLYASYRPDSITIKLFKDGVDTQLSVVLPEADDTPWEHTFTDLPFGEYSVEEIDVPDYTVTYSDNVFLNKFDDNHGISERTGQINITNTFDEPKGSIIVSKTWVETDVDASVVRPSSIVVSLQKDGAPFDTAELNAANNWTTTFDELLLDNGIYTVSESSTDSDKLSMYAEQISYSANEASESDLQLGPSSRSGTIAITNTYAKGTITVNKVWEDGNNPVAERPSGAFITLHKVTILPPIVVDPIPDPEHPDQFITPPPIVQPPVDETVATLAIVRPVNAPVVFYNLELGDNISYYITEGDIPFYNSSINKSLVVLNENNQNDSFTVTNTYTDPKGSLTVNKTWDHGNNPNQPTEVTVELYEDGIYKTQATFSSNYTFTGLDLGKTYTILEVSVDNYSADYNGFVSYKPVKGQSSVAGGSATIENTYIPELNDLTVNKDWVGLVGAPITVTLYRSVGEGLSLVGTTVLDNENEWSHTFTGLEIYGPGGVRYTYSVSENGAGLSLYDTDTSDTAQLNVEVPSEITITNTYSPNKGELTITKTWLGLDEEEITPPVDSVEVRLIVNGEPEETNMVLNAENNWTVVRTGLNAEATYSVEEMTTFEEFDVSYSASEITFDAENLKKSVEIINLRTEDQPSIDVNKSISNALVQLSSGTATFNYSVELINNGNRTLNALRVVDLMTGPQGSNRVYAPAPNSQDENGAVFELEGSLKPGDKVVFNYSVTVNLAGTYVNTATGYGYYVETEVSDDGTATAVATNPPTPTPDPDPTPNGLVNVTFVDTNGVTLSAGYQMVGVVGTNYSTTARDILGYDLVATPANANGTFINGTLSVVYVYDVPVEITTEETPLGEATTESTTEEEVIVDEGTPLGEALPQTGQLPPELFYGIGSIVTAAGVFMKRKNK